jgi:CRISPR-associated exonuclease Cas4
MFTEDDLVPLSALQHLLYCERQAALIHLERLWAENPYTAEGRQLHERVDSGSGESRGDLRIARVLPLRSRRLGLAGQSDVVEFHRLSGVEESGAALPGLLGRFLPFPVEYKRGRPKSHRADEVQLCAQGLCLEEMFGAEVPSGALFYAQTRARLDVAFDAELRRLTESTAERVHALLQSGRTPLPVREPKCDRCSLLDLCLPAAPVRSAARYLAQAAREALRERASPLPPESPA